MSLKRKQHEAIAALLEHSTIIAAAEDCGITRETLWRWMQRPDFQVAYRNARAQVFEAALSALQQASLDAAKTLHKILTDTAAPASVRVSASRTVLEMVLKAREVLEIEE